MRDREFAVAKKALIESTQDKTTIPESFRLIGNNVLHGKKGKQHTVIIGVPVPSVKLDYGRIELRGDGKLLEPPREFELRSWNRNFRNLMASWAGATDADDPLFQDGQINAKDTGGNVRSAARAYQVWYGESLDAGFSSPVTVSTHGIVVGTNAGSTAEQEDGWKLDTQIVHGVAGGQFYYATHQKPFVQVYSSPSLAMTLTRYFDNFEAGAGSIIVGEIALYSQCVVSATFYNVMVNREVLSPTVTVPFRAQLAVSFAFAHEYAITEGLLRNFHNGLFSQVTSSDIDDSGVFENGKLSVKATNGSVYSSATPLALRHLTSTHAAGYGYVGAAGSTTNGIVVGTDDGSIVPLSIDNHVLGAMIPNGVAAGNLQYSVSETPVVSWADPTLTVSHGRTVTNGSPGAVTVQEVGVIASYYPNNVNRLALVFREIIGDVIIAPTESLRTVMQFQQGY